MTVAWVRLLDGTADDRRLVLAEGQQADLAGGQDRADAHRDRLVGHVLFAEEIAGRVQPRHAVQVDQPRAAVAGGAGLVEADVPGAADAQNLQVDPAGLGDRCSYAAQYSSTFVARAVGDVDVFGAGCPRG